MHNTRTPISRTRTFPPSLSLSHRPAFSVFCLLAGGKWEGLRDVIAAGKARVVDLF